MDTTQTVLQTQVCKIINKKVNISPENDLNGDQCCATNKLEIGNSVNGIESGCKPKFRPNVNFRCTENRNRSNTIGYDQGDRRCVQSAGELSNVSRNCMNSPNDIKEHVSRTSSVSSLGKNKKEAVSVNDNNMNKEVASKSENIKACLQNSVSEDIKKKIERILEDVGQLSDVEKLLLYLQLPSGVQPDIDPLKQKVSGNPLGKKAEAEVAQTLTWITTHLEEDPDVSLPKQEVYEEYRVFCEANKIEPLCAADFGKVMKHVLPSVKPRRLGTRGNSRYCYSGLKKKILVDTPLLPDLDISGDLQPAKISNINSEDDHCSTAACHLLFEWTENLLNRKFRSVKELAYFLVENMYVDNQSVAAFTILSSGCGNDSEKGQIGILKHMPGSRRKETQMHLQRKLHKKKLIKEQKRKLDEQQTVVFKTQSSKSLLGNKTPEINTKLKSKLPSNPLEKHCILTKFADDVSSSRNIKAEQLMTSSPEYVYDADDEKRERHKSEPCIKSASASSMTWERALSAARICENSDEEKPKSVLVNSIRDCFGSMHSPNEYSTKINKLPIPRNSNNVSITQAMPSIIIVPSTFSHYVQVQSQCPAELSQKLSAWKYKKIQPKPVSEGTRLSSLQFKRNFSILKYNLQNKLEGHEKQDVPLISDHHLRASCSEKGGVLCKPNTSEIEDLCDDNQKADELFEKNYITFIEDSDAVTSKPDDLSLLMKDKLENITLSSSDIHPLTSVSSSSECDDYLGFDDHTELKFPVVSVNSANNTDLELYCEPSQQTIKRHFDENDPNLKKSKKPHLESAKNEPEKSGDEKCLPWTKLKFHNSLVRNCGLGLIGLGSTCVSESGNLILKQTDNEDVSIHELESDALMEYMQENDSDFSKPNKHTSVSCTSQNGTTHFSANCPISKSNDSSENNQLSQLRMLLEKNLPHTVAQGILNTKRLNLLTSEEIVKNSNNKCAEDKTIRKEGCLDNFSELRQALLRPAISNPTVLWKPSLKGRKTAYIGNVSSRNQTKHNEKICEMNMTPPQPYFGDNKVVPCFSGPGTKKDEAEPRSQTSYLFQEPKEQDLGKTGICSNFTDVQTKIGLYTSGIKVKNQLSGDLDSFTHLHSVLRCPDARRRSFNFVPITAHQTPHPDTASNSVSASTVLSHGDSSISTGTGIGAIGSSQPPSAASSPFVSPNTTPTPWATRSRHSSGQISHGATRYTPFQSIDSGVSSVTDSPFVSPHATPASISRLRHNSSHSQGKTVTFSTGPVIMHTQPTHHGHIKRSRHSSGPGCSLSVQPATSQLAAPRSAPLSPMNGEISSQYPFNLPIVSGTPVIHSFHNSTSSLNPLSPVSGHFSPNEHVKTELLGLSDVKLANDTQNVYPPMPLTFVMEDSETPSFNQDTISVQSLHPHLSALDVPDTSLQTQTGWTSTPSHKNNQLWCRSRQRHVSGSVLNPYSANENNFCDPLTQELQNVLKNPCHINIGNRSHSVPPHQMVQNCLNQNDNSDLFEEDLSKSHPSTPVVSQSLNFPSPSISHADELTKYNTVLSDSLSQQDHLQAPVNQSTKWNSFDNDCDNMEDISLRTIVNDLLHDQPLEDDLQATLEDLQACDDFSKFAEELEEDFKNNMELVI